MLSAKGGSASSNNGATLSSSRTPPSFRTVVRNLACLRRQAKRFPSSVIPAYAGIQLENGSQGIERVQLVLNHVIPSVTRNLAKRSSFPLTLTTFARSLTSFGMTDTNFAPSFEEKTKKPSFPRAFLLHTQSLKAPSALAL